VTEVTPIDVPSHRRQQLDAVLNVREEYFDAGMTDAIAAQRADRIPEHMVTLRLGVVQDCEIGAPIVVDQVLAGTVDDASGLRFIELHRGGGGIVGTFALEYGAEHHSRAPPQDVSCRGSPAGVHVQGEHACALVSDGPLGMFKRSCSAVLQRAHCCDVELIPHDGEIAIHDCSSLFRSP
jgi:hypothetical protein